MTEQEEFEFRARKEKEEAEAKAAVEDKVVNPAVPTQIGGVVGGLAGLREIPASIAEPVANRIASAFGMEAPNKTNLHPLSKWIMGEFTEPKITEGGINKEQLYQKNKVAAGLPVKSAGNVGKTGIRRGIPFQPEPELTFGQRAANVGKAALKAPVQAPAWMAEHVGALPLTRAGSGALTGYNLTNAWNALNDPEASKADVAVNVVGGVAPLAGTFAKSNKLRGVGLGLGTGAALYDYMRQHPDYNEDEKAEGGVVQGYADGRQVAAQGALDLVKKVFAPKATKIVRASEALGPHEGKYLNLTQSDRMRSTAGDLGGPGFSKFQLENPEYAGAAWGVGNKPTASSIVNINKRYPGGKAIWAPMIGSEGQHRSNQHVYDALTDEFIRQTSLGKLTPELRGAMNARLANAPKYKHLGLGEIDVGNPQQVKDLGNTFDRRAAISEVIGGEGVGGRKGQIFDYPGVMQEMTDPMTIGAPTHSMGTRLFTLSNEVEHRPDLHSAFPFILKGEDMGVAFNPVPKELAYPSWINMAKEFTGREPGYMELTRGIKGQGKPHQFIDEQYLRALEDAGHAEGGQIQGYADAGLVKKAVQAGLKALEPAQTVKAYKLFRTDPKAPESLFPLFVNANKPVPIGQWLPAEAGELTQAGKVKSKIGDLAYRPGWHAGDMPIATHIGGKSSPELTAPDFRPNNQVWAEVEMPADVDWQKVAMERAQRNKAGDIIPRTAHITDTIPEGGHYRYKTNPNMTGDWLIGGSMKVNRVLSPEEVMAINESKGVADLPRFELLPKKAEGGSSTPAWQRKEGKNPEGGLNAIGRASYNRETGGNLKAPQPQGGARKDSFCARMEGMKKKLTSSETANDPDSRINKSLRKWKC
jgi:hypothetical protein